MKQKITWLLFHEPAELFIRTARHFEAELNALTNDAFEFEILELEEYEALYCKGKQCDPLAELKAGRVQMSQIYINTLAYSNVTNFLALGLPFLFKDHAHATRVFEGTIGAELLEHVQDTIGIKGLSFTYSGGYKVMACNQPVSSIEDFKDLKFKQHTHAVSQDLFSALGATSSTETEADFRDTTLPRYHADARADQTYAINTGHAMYLTTILANDALWNSLSEEHQQAFRQASKIAAHAERLQSVEDAELIASNPELQSERGIHSVINLKPSDQEKLRVLLEPVREKWSSFFPNNLVERILAA